MVNNNAQAGSKKLKEKDNMAADNQYQNRYSKQVNDSLTKVLNREPYSYNVNDDALFSRFKSGYEKAGKTAMEDTVGDAAALTGGYGNSYAVSAGQQAYNNYLDKLSDKVTEYEQMAYNRYRDDEDAAYRRLNTLLELESTDYDRYRDSVADSRDKRDFDYKVSQDNRAQKNLDRDYSYKVSQDKLAQQNLDREFKRNVYQNDRDYNYRVSQDNRAQKNLDREYNRNVYQDNRDYNYRVAQDNRAQSNLDREYNRNVYQDNRDYNYRVAQDNRAQKNLDREYNRNVYQDNRDYNYRVSQDNRAQSNLDREYNRNVYQDNRDYNYRVSQDNRAQSNLDREYNRNVYEDNRDYNYRISQDNRVQNNTDREYYNKLSQQKQEQKSDNKFNPEDAYEFLQKYNDILYTDEEFLQSMYQLYGDKDGFYDWLATTKVPGDILGGTYLDLLYDMYPELDPNKGKPTKITDKQAVERAATDGGAIPHAMGLWSLGTQRLDY